MGHLKVLLTCAVVLSPGAVFADPVTIFSATREVRAWAGAGDDVESGGDAMTATATSAGASTSATLVSSLADPHNLFGTGTAVVTVTGPIGASVALNTFRVGFSLTTAHAYTFNATYAGVSSHQPGTNGEEQPSTGAVFDYELGADVTASNPVFRPDIFDHFAGSSTGASTFTHSGILQPGRYWFRAHSDVTATRISLGGASAAHAFSLQLSDPQVAPVPEPGSMLLLGTGLAGAGLRRWRQKRA